MQFFIRLPGASEDENLTLDHNPSTKVATIKAIVDAHLEAQWKASGVRILRSDLPFVGPSLVYNGRDLAFDRTLVENEVREGSSIHCVWQKTPEKDLPRRRNEASAGGKGAQKVQKVSAGQAKKKNLQGEEVEDKRDIEKAKTQEGEGASRNDLGAKVRSATEEEETGEGDNVAEDLQVSESDGGGVLLDEIPVFSDRLAAATGPSANEDALHVYESDEFLDAGIDGSDFLGVELFNGPEENKENEDPNVAYVEQEEP